MLSVNLIERHFQGHRFDQLLDGLSLNGLELPMSLRIRLAQHPASAIALGLRRLVDLTYGPTTASREMTASLLALQDADGSFGQDPLATACALAALSRLVHDEHRTADTEAGAAGGSEAAGQRALAALAAMQGDDGLMLHAADRTEQERALVTAFVLHLLAHDADFRAGVRFADMMDWFDQHHEALEEATEEFWRMARLDVTTLGTPDPVSGSPRFPAACAAIAA